MTRTINHAHMIPLFIEAVRQAQGTNSALIMEHDVKIGRHGINGQSWSGSGYDGAGNSKDHSIWLRWKQPCQGGEMRKYASIHGDECTQPESHKPQDLHHPFPEGNPVAVGVRFNYGSTPKPELVPILKFLYQDKSSPYRTGTGNTTFVNDKENNPVGVIIQDTKNVDPTVMVNLIQMTRSQVLGAGGTSINQYISEGATMLQAVALAFLQSQYPYYFAMVMDVRKFMDGEPNDLSKGISFFDRGDYNRINVHDLFTCDNKEVGAIWFRDFQSLTKTSDKIDMLMKKYAQAGGTKLLPVSQLLDDQPVKPKRVRAKKAA